MLDHKDEEKQALKRYLDKYKKRNGHLYLLNQKNSGQGVSISWPFLYICLYRSFSF